MINKRHSRIPHPSPDTIQTNLKEISAQSESPEVSSFPVDVHETTLNTMNK